MGDEKKSAPPAPPRPPQPRPEIFKRQAEISREIGASERTIRILESLASGKGNR